MAPPVVLLVHRDPVVLELIAGTLGDEFEFARARSAAAAQELSASRSFAVIVADATNDSDVALDLVQSLRARAPHVQAIFFADVRDTGSAWRLADFGTVVPKSYDLDRLRLAVRKAARLSAMSSGAEKLKIGRAVATDQTTKRLPKGQRRTESQSNVVTTRLHYGKGRERPTTSSAGDGGTKKRG